jgi:hypothetical protein
MHGGWSPWRATIIAATLLLVGCHDPLFPEDVPRSPYERYSTLRGQDPSATERDEYGVNQPNLRKRLRPLAE